VRFENVTFAYPQRPDVLVLNGLDIQLRPGETTAIVGPSGAGKSSLVQLLLGFYQPFSGSILMNGTALSEVPEGVLRRHVAWVPQEPYLFGFSIFQNLVLGNPGMDRAAVERLTGEWSFLAFVKALPDGLDTVLGEQGTQLSGGQRQRIAIARALLRRPTVLILDEATSGLDSETEEQVVHVLRAWLPNATVLIISHRLATIRAADTVYVLTQGRVEGHGTHDELKGSNNLYQQYVARQALD
jgi:ATP-binding cassette subfamily B protein